ncbi:MAG: hypothetical protein KAR07_03115 [Spirochaetes bacterium]|nr:hypothetical protein [Spirochaetota bacterium]MCK5592119.1 hypothetical protein [Candidatus Paceibacterota bacterium]
MTKLLKSKKLVVYKLENGQIALNAMEKKNNKFVTRSPTSKYGKALSPKVSNEELGKAVKAILKNCT